MATGKVIGRVEVSLGKVSLVDVEGNVRPSSYEDLMYEGEQIYSDDPRALFQIKYLALEEATAYDGVFRVLADGSVIAGLDGNENMFGDDIDLMETAAGDGGTKGSSAFLEEVGEDEGSDLLGFGRGADDTGYGLGITGFGVEPDAGDQSPPIITSANDVIFDENGTGSVMQITADDASAVTFSISGLDSGLFSIDPVTGILTFNDSPDYENPLDLGGDNEYNFYVTVTDALGNFTTQLVSVNVNNLNDNIPTADDATNSATEDVLDDGSGYSAIGQLVGDDADGNEFEFELVNDVPEGSLVLNSDGSYTFSVEDDFQDLAVGETRDITFTYQTVEVGPPLSEPSDAGPFESEIATVTITVTGTNDQPSVSDINANGLPVEFEIYLMDDGENGNGRYVNGRVVYESTSTGNPLEDNDESDVLTLFEGNLATAVDADVSDTHTYHMVQGSVRVDGMPTQSIIVGQTGGGELGLDNWGVEADGGHARVMTLDNGMTITTSSDSKVLRQYDHEAGHIGEGIGDRDGSGINADETITVAFGGGFVTSASFGFDGLGGHFQPNGVDARATWVAYNNGVEVASGEVQRDGDNFVEISSDIPFDTVVFGTDSDAGSNWELRYVEAQVIPVDVVVDENGEYDVEGNFNYLAAGETAVVTFQYYADDQQGFGTTGDGGANEASLSEPKTVTLTITGTNDVPVAVSDTGTTSENVAVSIDVLANDTDVDNGAYFTLDDVSVDDGYGSVSIVGNELFFDPGTDFDYLAEGQTTEVVVTYTMSDEHGAESSSTATITVTGTNDAPIASMESVTKIADFIPAENLTYTTDDFDGLTVSAYYNDHQPANDVVQSGAWGVRNSLLDSPQIDGFVRNDTIVFTFDDSFDSARVNLKNFDNNDRAIWRAYDGTTLVGSGDYTNNGGNDHFYASANMVAGSEITRIEVTSTSHHSEFLVKSIITHNAEMNTILPFVVDDTMLLANDIDAEGDALHVELTADTNLYTAGGTVVIGSVSINGDGDIEVTPNAMYDVNNSSEATFSYIVVDEHGAESGAVIATIDVEVGTVTGSEVSYDQTTGEFIIGTDDNSEGALTDNTLTVSDTLDLSNVSDINTIELEGDATVTGTDAIAGINAADVMSASGDSNTLVIESVNDGITNEVNIDESSLVQQANQNIGGIDYAVYSDGTATLLIDINEPIDVV